jgi:hypothetical protein
MARYTPTNKAYVYTHKRLDKNCIFYVGIGSSANQKRAYETHKRNDYWLRVNNITEIEVEVLFEDLTWEVANYYEKYLIAVYGRKNKGTGDLVNMTDGGDGVRGWVVSDKTKRKMSLSKMGNLHSASAEARLKNILAHSKPVIQMTRQGEFIKEWFSAMDVAKELFGGTGQSKIGDCCRGTRKTHKNFTWKFKNN